MRSTRIAPAPAVLVERDDDRTLQEQGYVVVPLIGAEAAAELRAAFGDLHGWSRHQLIEDQPPDFEITMTSSDAAYQREIADLVDRHVQAAIEQRFETHRTIGRAIMVKWPSGPDRPHFEGVPNAFHADAPFVDERTGARTYRIWLALQDIDQDNGGLQVVPHTNRLERPVRGWGVEAPWLDHTEVFAQRAVPVPMRAGEAIIFDPALIHRSGPNTTDEARVAVSILLAEPGQQLCIFRAREDGTAERVDLGPGFFTDGRYQDLTVLPATEVVVPTSSDLTAVALAEQLDRYGRPRGRARAWLSGGSRRGR